MLAVTFLQVAVVVVTAVVVFGCVAFAAMEARRLRNPGQYLFAAQVARRPSRVPTLAGFAQAGPAPSATLVDLLVDSMTQMSVQAVRAELSAAS